MLATPGPRPTGFSSRSLARPKKLDRPCSQGPLAPKRNSRAIANPGQFTCLRAAARRKMPHKRSLPSTSYFVGNVAWKNTQLQRLPPLVRIELPRNFWPRCVACFLQFANLPLAKANNSQLWTFLKFLRRCESRDWLTGLDAGLHIPTAPAAAPSRPVTDTQWLGRHANIQAQKGDIRSACLTGIYLFSTW